MKTLLLLATCAICAFASQTQIAGFYVDPLNTGASLLGANCTIAISGPSRMGTTAGGQDFGAVSASVDITNGNYSFYLTANDALEPAGTSYAATYTCWHGNKNNSITYKETWVVHTSATPLTLGALRVSVVPSPTVTFDITQLKPPAGPGTFCITSTNGSTPVWATCSGGGGGGLSLATLTNTDLSTLTNTQLTSLTN